MSLISLLIIYQRFVNCPYAYALTPKFEACKAGYFGDTCDMWNCSGLLYNTTNICNNGTCSSPENCSCFENYYGQTCEKWDCFGTYYNDSRVCASRGQCVAPNVCECFSPDYAGSDCQFDTCCMFYYEFILIISIDGISQNDSRVCSGRGKCVSYNSCQCTNWYGGSNCQFSFQTTAITLIVMGCILVILITLCLIVSPIFLCYYIRTKRKQLQQSRAENEMRSLLSSENSHRDYQSSYINEDWIIHIEDLVFKERLSEGAFGIVFCGLYRNSDVAIKVCI